MKIKEFAKECFNDKSEGWVEFIEAVGYKQQELPYSVIENKIIETMVKFAHKMCEMQKIRVSDVMEDVVYDDRIGNMSYESVEKAILNAKNVCED